MPGGGGPPGGPWCNCMAAGEPGWRAAMAEATMKARGAVQGEQALGARERGIELAADRSATELEQQQGRGRSCVLAVVQHRSSSGGRLGASEAHRGSEGRRPARGRLAVGEGSTVVVMASDGGWR